MIKPTPRKIKYLGGGLGGSYLPMHPCTNQLQPRLVCSKPGVQLNHGGAPSIRPPVFQATPTLQRSPKLTAKVFPISKGIFGRERARSDFLGAPAPLERGPGALPPATSTGAAAGFPRTSPSARPARRTRPPPHQPLARSLARPPARRLTHRPFTPRAVSLRPPSRPWPRPPAGARFSPPTPSPPSPPRGNSSRLFFSSPGGRTLSPSGTRAPAGRRRFSPAWRPAG